MPFGTLGRYLCIPLPSMYPLSRGETNDVQDFSSEAGTINLALEVFHKEDQLL